MSSEAINIQDYIERVAQIYEADQTIFPPEGTGESLVTDVFRTKPAIEQSHPEGILPYILVFESLQPIKFLEKAGRDNRNEEGITVYEVEIYSVVITDNELTPEDAQRDVHIISAAMRTAMGKNLRMADPSNLTLDPLCRTLTRFEINYILKGNPPPSMFARNVVVRPQVYTSLRTT